jgi:adenosylmethionine-8-amino-7-oxononanoate aminotransferase
MEPILGAGGVIVPHESFMPGVEKICRKHGILLIADEVITAFGRTGAWTGSRLWGVKPDFACTAKAITNGYFPFGAVMIAEGVAQVFEQDDTGRAAIGHGYTYSGHPVGAAAALACLRETLRIDVRPNSAARGAQLFAGMQALQARFPVIGDVRGGRGLMLAMELVSNRETKAAPDKALAAKVQEIAYKAGAMVRVSGPNIIVSPPLVLTEGEADVILNALEAGFAGT